MNTINRKNSFTLNRHPITDLFRKAVASCPYSSRNYYGITVHRPPLLTTTFHELDFPLNQTKLIKCFGLDGKTYFLRKCTSKRPANLYIYNMLMHKMLAKICKIPLHTPENIYQSSEMPNVLHVDNVPNFTNFYRTDTLKKHPKSIIFSLLLSFILGEYDTAHFRENLGASTADNHIAIVDTEHTYPNQITSRLNEGNYSVIADWVLRLMSFTSTTQPEYKEVSCIYTTAHEIHHDHGQSCKKEAGYCKDKYELSDLFIEEYDALKLVMKIPIQDRLKFANEILSDFQSNIDEIEKHFLNSEDGFLTWLPPDSRSLFFEQFKGRIEVMQKLCNPNTKGSDLKDILRNNMDSSNSEIRKETIKERIDKLCQHEISMKITIEVITQLKKENHTDIDWSKLDINDPNIQKIIAKATSKILSDLIDDNSSCEYTHTALTEEEQDFEKRIYSLYKLHGDIYCDTEIPQTIATVLESYYDNNAQEYNFKGEAELEKLCMILKDFSRLTPKLVAQLRFELDKRHKFLSHQD